ncbi:hypothetical protein HanRHA438_Chr12g0534711 [Helianthus annuus]|nr:hypothetical protein HanRHA438_Chr12g0534711 [Helianthus annuus]
MNYALHDLNGVLNEALIELYRQRNRVFKRTSRSGHALEGNALKVMLVSFRMSIKKGNQKPNTSFEASALI